MELKTFNDLVFKPHWIGMSFDSHAIMEFDNGYGISVVTGPCAYSDDKHPYECAVMREGNVVYDTTITDDVVGHCTESDVTEIMKKIQQL